MIDVIEKRLAKKFKRKYCILTGSGTAALYMILKILGLKKHDGVLLPGTCCYAPAYAVKYADYELDFCDVSLADGCLSADSLEVVLKDNPRIKVVIGVHLYGNAFDIDAIEALCKKYKVTLIEDVCQAYGSFYKNSLCGTRGEFSVLSFGHTKILDAGGLGALLTDNREAAVLIRKLSDGLGDYSYNDSQQLWDRHRKEYYAIKSRLRSSPKKKLLFGNLWHNYKKLFVHGIDRRLFSCLKGLLDNEKLIFNHRVKLANLYKRYLFRSGNISILESQYETVPWRFSFLLNLANTQAVSDCIRAAGFDVSNWYPNLATMFAHKRKRTLVNSNLLENRIINMWVDQTKDKPYVEQICSLLNKLLSDKNSKIRKEMGSHGKEKSIAFC